MSTLSPSDVEAFRQAVLSGDVPAVGASVQTNPGLIDGLWFAKNDTVGDPMRRLDVKGPALVWAVSQRQWAMAHALLALGADPFATVEREAQAKNAPVHAWAATRMALALTTPPVGAEDFMEALVEGLTPQHVGGHQKELLKDLPSMAINGSLRGFEGLVEALRTNLDGYSLLGGVQTAMAWLAESTNPTAAQRLERLLPLGRPDLIRNAEGLSLLEMCINQGSLASLDLLLPLRERMSKNPTSTLLLHAVARQDEEAHERVLRLLPFSDVNAQTEDGLTPLMHMARRGRWGAPRESVLQNVRLLLEQSDLLLRDTTGKTALDWLAGRAGAVSSRVPNTAIEELIVAHWPPEALSAPGGNGCSALKTALEKGNWSLADLLCAHVPLEQVEQAVSAFRAVVKFEMNRDGNPSPSVEEKTALELPRALARLEAHDLAQTLGLSRPQPQSLQPLPSAEETAPCAPAQPLRASEPLRSSRRRI